MSAQEAFFQQLWKNVLPESHVADRLRMIRSLQDKPLEFLRQAGIEYRAPADASRTALPDGAIDIHTSVSVFEHIPGPVLGAILSEAKRIVRPGGAFLHLIDPTDHLAHGDSSITYVNFLRFTTDEWAHYNENPFCYQNRLFDSDYRGVFADAGLTITEATSLSDERSLKALQDGFSLAAEFQARDPKDLAKRDLCYFGFV
jgi:hypothetical protein